jgi:sugar lactone lactonase YvrE
LLRIANLTADAKWLQEGVSVAGGNGQGNESNQLSEPRGFFIDDDEQRLYIADYHNNRIMEWKYGATTGRIVAGGNEAGNRDDQLYYPRDIILDRENDCLVICDSVNGRVVRWARQNSTRGETIIRDIRGFGMAMDDEIALYIVDFGKNEVKRYRMGESEGTVVAGGNGQGDSLDQFSGPKSLTVDAEHSVYVSDFDNSRVMKWLKGAKQGTLVAGGQGVGESLAQLQNPQGIVLDESGTVYISDYLNHRIVRWPRGASNGSILVGGKGPGNRSDQLDHPSALGFNRKGDLYVVDSGNHRVQMFRIYPTT